MNSQFAFIVAYRKFIGVPIMVIDSIWRWVIWQMDITVLQCRKDKALESNIINDFTCRPGIRMKKVLVIDDNPTIVELIKYAVNLQGSYEVVVAFDGVQGLERVYTEQPDCVIVDVKMPRMDGYQLVRSLRGDPRTVDIPLIILSAMTRDEDQMVGFLSGVDEYLTKPFKPAGLHAAMERVMHLTPAERQQRMDHLVQAQADRD
jgi:two-component system alkaline phosphatase synthesis response regulator PhoP